MAVHSAGVPTLSWSGTVIGTALALRITGTLPLAVLQARVAARLELLAPHLLEWQVALRHKLAASSRKAGVPYDEYRQALHAAFRAKRAALWRAHHCHPLWLLVLPWLQAPIWMVLSIALRDMAGAPIASWLRPADRAVADAAVAEFVTGGALWYPDLTVPDATFLLPLLIGIVNLANLEVL